MATTNDITGDSIQTGVVTDAYRNNYDEIFGKKTPKEIDDQQAEDEAFEDIQRIGEKVSQRTHNP